jgi:hypothetical protein
MKIESPPKPSYVIYGFTLGTGSFAAPRKRRVHSQPCPPSPHPSSLPPAAASTTPPD